MANLFRPKRLNDIIGQNKVREALDINCKAAKKQNRPISHILFLGSSGQGKTTLAQAVATELGTKFIEANGASASTLKTLLPYIASITENSVLFFDECHRINKRAQEALFTVLEDGKLFMGDGEETITLNIPNFTFIGATTELGMLTSPFINRFPLHYHLEPYSTEELAKIIKISAEKIRVDISEKAVIMLASLSRKTPRIANNRLLLIRDCVVANGMSQVNEIDLPKILKLIGIDKYGFDRNDRKYIRYLQEHKNKPVGLKTISSAISISVETIENVIEPYLLSLGVILKTTKGRKLLK